MTGEERVRAVAALGFTERQAGFLVAVMLHAGVCVGRQYCAYCRITYGQKVVDFFRSLLDRGYATARPTGTASGRLFHIHNKRLYRAIGEADNRHRRPTTLPRAIERLMVLDAVLEDRDRNWLATEREKVAHFTLLLQVPPRDLPTLVFRSDDGETTRYFPDKLPIAVQADNQIHVFVYLATCQSISDPSSSGTQNCFARFRRGGFACSFRFICATRSPHTRPPSTSKWRARFVPSSWRSSAGFFTRAAAAPLAQR
jgi:hypothetical protein